MLKRSVLNQYAYSPILNSINMNESKKSKDEHFDIFLCHSSKDKSEIKYLKAYLKEKGYNAYVDWIDDPQLDRSEVTQINALTLQIRMQRSDKLFFVLSKNSSSSLWMPWELGYFDNKSRDNVYVYPIIDYSEAELKNFNGQEYLGLYPIAEVTSYRNLSENKNYVRLGGNARI